MHPIAPHEVHSIKVEHYSHINHRFRYENGGFSNFLEKNERTSLFRSTLVIWEMAFDCFLLCLAVY